MLFEVVVGAVGYSLQLRPAAERIVVLDVHSPGGVVRFLFRCLLTLAELVRIEAQVQVPVEAFPDPVLVPGLVRAWLDEELHLHLFELAGAEDEVSWCDLVPERLADLGYPERHLYPAGLEHVLEVDEDPLRRLGPQISQILRGLDGTHVGLEHQVEGPAGREVAPAVRRVLYPLVLLDDPGQLLGAQALGVYTRGIFDEVIGPVATLARAALDEHVVEGGRVPRSLPHFRVHDYGRVETDHVLAHVDHAAPPLLFDVALHLDTKRPVIVGGTDSTVDLRALVHEAPSLAEGHYLVHRHGLGHESSELLGSGKYSPERPADWA